MSFLNELKRRNVLRVGAAYLVSSWLVIQVAETIFPLFGYGDTPARLVVIVLSIAFIPSLVFSWVFEITSEGLKRDADVDRDHSITQVTGKKLDRIILVVLALALAYFAFDKFILDPARDQSNAETARQEGRSEALLDSFGDKSIAVLPFVDMSADGDQEYMSDGVAEELTSLLAKISELRVSSRSSAFAFKGEKIDITEVAKKLGVAYILEGSVRKAGSRLRITIQLIETRSDSHVWSETYDRSMGDIFAIQDEIAATVAAQLRITLLGDVPVVPRTDPEAYNLFLLAEFLSKPGKSVENLRESVAALKQALDIDPNFARAWRKLAVGYRQLVFLGELSSDEAYPLQMEAVNKSIKLEPDYAPSYTTLGSLAAQRDLTKAAHYFNRAVEIAPYDPIVQHNSANFLMHIGRINDALAVYEYMYSHHQPSTYTLLNYSEASLFAGLPDQAIAAGEEMLQIRPYATLIRYYMGRAFLLKGQPETALDLFEQEADEWRGLLGKVMAYHTMGQPKASDAALYELIQKFGHQRAFFIAGAMAYRNEPDRAFEWLERAVDNHEPDWYIVAEPLLANIREDPRWLPFVESRNRSPAELDAIDFEIPLPN